MLGMLALVLKDLIELLWRRTLEGHFSTLHLRYHYGWDLLMQHWKISTFIVTGKNQIKIVCFLSFKKNQECDPPKCWQYLSYSGKTLGNVYFLFYFLWNLLIFMSHLYIHSTYLFRYHKLGTILGTKMWPRTKQSLFTCRLTLLGQEARNKETKKWNIRSTCDICNEATEKGDGGQLLG